MDGSVQTEGVVRSSPSQTGNHPSVTVQVRTPAVLSGVIVDQGMLTVPAPPVWTTGQMIRGWMTGREPGARIGGAGQSSPCQTGLAQGSAILTVTSSAAVSGVTVGGMGNTVAVMNV